MSEGLTTPNIPATAMLDEVIGNRDGSTVKIPVDAFATQLSADLSISADRAAAVAARSDALAARDGAALNARKYASVAAAQADATLAVNEPFFVESGTEMIFYMKNSSSASTETFRLLTNHQTRPIGIRTSAVAAPYRPNLNSATQELTIPQDCILALPRAPYSYVVPAPGAVIDTSNGGVLGTTARNVYFRTDTQTFEVRSWLTPLTYAETLTHNLVAIIRRVATPTTPEMNTLEMGCDCTVDGIVSKNQPGILCPIVLPALAGYLPNLDSTANQLYIPGDIHIIAAGSVGGKQASYYVASGATIDLSVAVSTAKKIYRSISGATYVVKDATAILTGFEVSDLLLVAVVRRSGSTGNYLEMNCAHLVDGALPVIGKDERQTNWAAIFPPLDPVSAAKYYPEYFRATRTLRFYLGTVFRSGEKRWVTTADVDVVIPLDSSAYMVFWNTSNNTIYAKAWSTDLTRSEAIASVSVAAVRDTPYSWVPPSIDIKMPYAVDGKLFGFFADFVGRVAENRAGMAIEGVHHRGSSLGPENTLAAFKLSAKNGTYCVETDVSITSDGIPVLLHDETVDRTSNGTGRIDSMTLAAAKALDFGSKKSAQFAGEQIPTWYEFLLLCKKLNLYARAEVKPNATLAQVQSILLSIKKLGMKGRVQLTSFHQPVLQKVVTESPTQDVEYLVVGVDNTVWTAALAFAVSSLKTGQNQVWIGTTPVGLTQARVEEAHLLDFKVCVYVADTPAAVDSLANLGVDAIGTDVLTSVAQTLRDLVIV